MIEGLAASVLAEVGKNFDEHLLSHVVAVSLAAQVVADGTGHQRIEQIDKFSPREFVAVACGIEQRFGNG